MQNVCNYNAGHIGHRGIRSVLTDEQLRTLETASSRKAYKAGASVFKEGDTTAHSFIVLSGVLKLTRLHPDRERHIAGLMFPGDLICGAFKPKQTCSAEAATDLVLCAMPSGTFSSLCEEAPRFERFLFREALRELEASHDWMLLLRGCSAYQRVAGFLRLTARCATAASGLEETGRARFTLPLSRAEIAGFLGITIETVSRQMTLMKKKGVIELPVSRDSRDVIVPDLTLLTAHAEGSLAVDGTLGVQPDCGAIQEQAA